MNPAAPVTSAFTRTPRGSAPAAGTAARSRSSAACTVRPEAATSAVRRSRTTCVVELHPHRRQHPPFRPHLELVVVPRRPLVLTVRLDHRQRRRLRAPSPDSSIRATAADPRAPPRTRRSSWRSRRRPSCRSRRTARARGTRRAARTQRATQACRPAAAARAWRARDRRCRKSRCPPPGSSAPAATRRAAFDASMPPSTSIGRRVAGARRAAARTARILDSLRGMKVCPPNPGLTDITSTRSTSRGDLLERDDRRGRVDRHARLGAERLDRAGSCGAGAAATSTCTEIIAAPASTNASM